MHSIRTGMGEYIFIRSLTQTLPKPETRCLLHKYALMKKEKCRVCTEALYNIF